MGDSTIHVAVSGLDRSFRVHRPAAAPASAGYPVVMMLHGGLGSAAQAESSYGWDVLADQAGFVVVYPEGIDRTWNAGTCCGAAQRDNIDDAAFLATVIENLSIAVSIDPKRRYLTGMSNGAMMSYRMACQSTLFAAIAPVAGTQLVDCRQGAPTSVLHIHGAEDDTVRVDGRRGGGRVAVTGPPIAEVIDGWRRRDGCPAPTSTVTGLVTTNAAHCPQGREVTSIMVAGAGHQWPGSTGRGYPGADVPSPALDATATIWAFFNRHQLS